LRRADVNARPATWDPPPEQRTAPDQLPAEAWRAVDLFEGELARRCWRTARGYLLLTNLRCLMLWQHHELFRSRDWEASPQVLLYNVQPPHVVLGRFVEVQAAYDPAEGSIRAAVADPNAVAEEIAAEVPRARAEWDRRRTQALAELAAHRARRDQIAAALAAGRPVPIPRVPCKYCGNLMPITARTCPTCGAPAG
jgi:hypothetical protein